MSLLVVGSVAFDGIETPHGKVDRTLGGAASYFALAASHFTPVRLVAIVGEDFTAKDEAVFRGRRIDLAGLEHAPGKTFFWAGRYSQNMNERTTLVTDLNVFANFNPTLPKAYRDSSSIFLANIDPKLQLSVLKQVHGKPKVIGLDTMNYWIERTPAELRETLKHVANPDDQRRRNAPADRRAQSACGGEARAQDGAEDARDQARRAWRADGSQEVSCFRCQHTRSKKCSIPPVRATALPAASWDTWPRRGSRE